MKQQLVINKDVHKFIRGFEAYGRHEATYEQVPQLESTDDSDSEDDQQPLLGENHKLESKLPGFNESVSISGNEKINAAKRSANPKSQINKGILKSPKKNSNSTKHPDRKAEKSPKKTLTMTKNSEKTVKSAIKSSKSSGDKSKKSPKKSPKSTPKKSPKSSKKLK